MPLKFSELQTHDEVLAEELRDPEFRAEWERLTLARAVGECVLRYRSVHALSQRQLAGILGIKQPQVARLEAGAHDPSLSTLRLLSDQLGMEFVVHVSPPRRRVGSDGSQRPRAPRFEFEEEAELSTGTRIKLAAR
jgi:transcriptional regulator with XRE-family HTH domain